jgi:Zn-dependent protease
VTPEAPTRAPSPVFLVLVAAFVLSGALAWADVGDWTVFAFVVSGWLVSLCLHEFAHAITAYRGGDRSVAEKGYLTLDLRNYAEPGLSLLLPMLFVLMGGIGLPGGAVWINRAALRSTRVETTVSLAGPAANVVFALACLLPLGLDLVAVTPERITFLSALGFLGFLQVTAAVLNLLPVPGLDGYGAVSPHLSWELQAKLAPVRRWGIFALIVVLLLPGPNAVFFDGIDAIIEMTGADPAFSDNGYFLFRFWDR